MSKIVEKIGWNSTSFCFRPHGLSLSCHTGTLAFLALENYLRVFHHIPSEREIFTLKDKGQIGIDWVINPKT